LSNVDAKKLLRIDLGLTEYRQVWEIQKKLVRRRIQSQIPDCLLITEHQPVITMGRGTDPRNLLVSPDVLSDKGIDLCEIERGGDITFHGPGQAVLYPIIDLQHREKDVHKYLRDLERFTVEALGALGLAATVKDGLTGIWVEDYKVGAIGVAVSRWVTYHGIALNVDTDLEYFTLINPCGITDYPVGTISQFLDKKITLGYVNDLLSQHFARVFEYDVEQIDDIEEVLGDND
jgi:lipoate-protein ligase B